MKQKLFIIFSDLDGTFLPLKDDTFNKLVAFIKDLKKREDVKVKFCPITGRCADYTLNFMNDINERFKKNGIENVVEFAGSEQGSVVIENKNGKPSIEKVGIKNKEDLTIFEDVNKFVKNSKYNDYLTVDEDRFCSSFFKVREEVCKLISKDRIKQIFEELKKDLLKEFGDKILPTPYRFLFDVTIPKVSKDTAINHILSKYDRSYNTVGFSYSGDAENDIKAFTYVSKLAEIGGIKAHIILPSNIKECVKCDELEAWKDKYPDFKKTIEVSQEPLFDGVIDLLRKKLDDKTLVANRKLLSRSADDLCI